MQGHWIHFGVDISNQQQSSWRWQRCLYVFHTTCLSWPHLSSLSRCVRKRGGFMQITSCDDDVTGTESKPRDNLRKTLSFSFILSEWQHLKQNISEIMEQLQERFETVWLERYKRTSVLHRPSTQFSDWGQDIYRVRIIHLKCRAIKSSERGREGYAGSDLLKIKLFTLDIKR